MSRGHADLGQVTVQPMCWCLIVVLVYAGPAACRYGWGILEEYVALK